LFLQQQSLGVRTALPVNVAYVDEGDNLSLNDIARWDLSESLTFRNILGFDAATEIYAKDSDNTVLPIAAIPSSPYDQTIRQITEEAQLLGKSFAGHLNWIVGAFYLDQAPPKNFEVETEEIFGFENDNETRVGALSRALFAQGTYDMSAVLPRVSVTAGARYTWDHRSQDGSGGAFGSVCTEPQANCGAIITASDENSKALTWTAALDYQATPGTLLYLTSRRGYRAGGYNQPGQPGFSPEYVKDVEIGIKSDWKAGTVPIRTNADLYYQKYTDIQTSEAIANATTLTSITANAAAARIMGAEFEALAQLTTNFELGVSFDYLDFNYTHFDPGVDSAQLIASRTFGRPPRKYGVNARYQLPLGAQIGEISMRANWNWQAATTTDVFNAADGSRPSGMVAAYGLLNLSADWNNIYGHGFDVSLFASNATNKVYSIGGGGSAYTQVGYANGMYGDPRMYGVRVRYRLGAESR
jgi:iron complex outermembrane recepter protein